MIIKPSIPSSDFSIPHKEILSPILSGRSSFDDNSKNEISEKSLKNLEKESSSNNTAFSMDFREDNSNTKTSDTSNSQQGDKTEEIIKKKLDFLDNNIKFKSFDLLRLIGKGSFGQVFLVSNLKNLI